MQPHTKFTRGIRQKRRENKNHKMREMPLKLKIERKQFSQPMRKYPVLALKTSKYMDLLMGLCCKMAEIVEFSKTWVNMIILLPIIDNGP